MSDKKPWTKARVLKAYTEWHELNQHTGDVVADYDRIWGIRSDFDELRLPGWIGTGWPGREFEFNTWNHDEPERLPIEYLWTEAWKAKLQAEHDAQKASAEGQRKEREEKAEFERLKAKFEAAS